MTDTLSVAAQYFFNWQDFSNQAYRYPESGTYLSRRRPAALGRRVVHRRPERVPRRSIRRGPQYLRAWRGKDITPEENSGNYGLAVRWSPEWLSGTLGAYYRKTYDMQPQLMLTQGVVPSLASGVCRAIGGDSFVPAAAPPTTAGPCIINQKATNRSDLLHQGQARRIQHRLRRRHRHLRHQPVEAVSSALSLGAELSYRQNMSLLSDAVSVLPAPLVAAARRARSRPPTCRSTARRARLGDTMHGLVNLVGVVGETPVFDTASWSTELTWMTVARREPERGRVQGPQGLRP